MSVASYMTSALDHSRIVIGVKYGANTNTESVKFVLEKLESHKSLVINDAGFTINISFDSNVSPQNSQWGPFQAHRQVYGIIYIGEATNPMEAALILDKFNKLKEAYNSGLYHSRCIIFGIDTTIRPSHSQDVFQFSSHHAWKSVDYDIKQFVTSIFYELESKRLRMAQERSGKPALITAPFENANEKNNETESKTMRKKCSGRHYKHLADVNLLVGQISEALQCYHTALDILIPVDDSVWVGSALEGLCVVSALVYFAELKLEEMAPTKQPLTFTLDPRNLSSKQTASLATPEIKKLCITSIKDLVDRYREAIIHYSRCKSLAVIEMEACIKATKVFAEAKKFLEASEFIQNAVYINLNVSDAERLQRYSVMADLYKNIGFHRKSAFYKRVAAMQCVAPHIRDPNWELCNQLLMSTIPRSAKHSDDTSYLKDGHGWPSISLRLLHELVYSLEKINNHGVAIRHLLYLLLNMFPYLSENDEKSTCFALENYAKKNISMEGDASSSELDFYALPVLKKVSTLFQDEGMTPVKSKSGHNSQSVFIYTPTTQRSNTHELKKLQFTWCVNTSFDVVLNIFNPLSHCSIKITEFSLILDSKSSAMDCQPQSFIISPQSSFQVQLEVTPVALGTVTIIGYAFTLFGVNAKCYFDKSNIETVELQLQIIGELPLLQCSKKHDFIEEKDDKPVVVTYFGEKSNVPFILTNIGQQPVCDWNISFRTKPNAQEISMTVEKNIKDCVLSSGKGITLPVHIESKMLIKENVEELLCAIIVKYAGQIGDEKWWRSMDVNFLIKPGTSVVVKSIEVGKLNSDPSNSCFVQLLLKNTLQRDVNIHFQSLGDDDTPSDNTIPVQCDEIKVCRIKVKKMNLRIHENKTESTIEDLCISHIKEMLNLKWKIEHDNNGLPHEGNIHLPCTISHESCCNLINCPIGCSILFDSTSLSTSLSAFTTTDEIKSVVFQFYNNSNIMHDLKVSLDIFQDQGNGYIERNLSECVVFSGFTQTGLCIKAGESVQFKTDLMFLRDGSFDLRARYSMHLSGDKQLKNSEKSLYFFSPVLTFVVQS